MRPKCLFLFYSEVRVNSHIQGSLWAGHWGLTVKSSVIHPEAHVP